MQQKQLAHTEDLIRAFPHKPLLTCAGVEPKCNPGTGRGVTPAWWREGSCAAQRAMLAALRQAELASWQANGGDCLRRSGNDSQTA